MSTTTKLEREVITPATARQPSSRRQWVTIALVWIGVFTCALVTVYDARQRARRAERELVTLRAQRTPPATCGYGEALAYVDGAWSCTPRYRLLSIGDEISGVFTDAGTIQRASGNVTLGEPAVTLRTVDVVITLQLGEDKPLVDLERKAIQAALEACGNNVTAAAACLRIHRQVLQRKMRRLGLRAPR